MEHDHTILRGSGWDFLLMGIQSFYYKLVWGGSPNTKKEQAIYIFRITPTKGLGYHNPFIWNPPSPGFGLFVCFIMSLSRREQILKLNNNKKSPLPLLSLLSVNLWLSVSIMWLTDRIKSLNQSTEALIQMQAQSTQIDIPTVHCTH